MISDPRLPATGPLEILVAGFGILALSAAFGIALFTAIQLLCHRDPARAGDDARRLCFGLGLGLVGLAGAPFLLGYFSWRMLRRVLNRRPRTTAWPARHLPHRRTEDAPGETRARFVLALRGDHIPTGPATEPTPQDPCHAATAAGPAEKDAKS